MVTIKAIDLLGIAVAAEHWFKEMNKLSKTFLKEEKAATALKKQLKKAEWDCDAELFIDEKPF